MTCRLIEYDIPLAEISEASAREKSIRHGPPSMLHVWWARRPLAAAHFIVYTVLTDSPDGNHPEE